MDIKYLLFLQNIRETYVPFLIPYMEMISYFAITYIILIPALIYWTKDKKTGRYILSVWGIANAVNAVMKLTFCCYRPWIRDARILPAGDAITTATGYSFPSGHTVCATSIYGSTAYCSYKNRQTILTALLIAITLVTGFSRNFLGVHTPQDVVVGMTEGIIAIFAVSKGYAYLDEHPEKMDRALLTVAGLAGLALVYITVKPYPMTYVNGALLVDPVKMRYDGVQDISALIIMAAAIYVDKTWIKYEPVKMKGLQVVITAAAAIGLCAILNYMKPVCIEFAGPNPGRVIYDFIKIFYIMVLVPAVLKYSARSEQAEPVFEIIEQDEDAPELNAAA